MRFTIRFATIVGFAALVSGCSNIYGAGVATIPRQPFSDGAMQLIAKKYLEAVDLSNKANPVAKSGSWLDFAEKCAAHARSNDTAELTKCKTYRDLVIDDLVLIINYNYNSYEGNLLAGRAKSDFYAGSARTAFETGATLIDATGVKTVLSALATFTGNTKTLANEAFYYEQTGPALINAMRADRIDTYASILVGKKTDYKDYPISAAMADLDAYFRAGTIASSVIRLSRATAQNEADAQEKLACVEKETDVQKARTCPN